MDETIDMMADMTVPLTTPSPNPTTSPTSAHQSGASARRPNRKSTMTQQQKNQKRQRATQDQLVTLEVEFNKNPTPTAGVRERIAQEINMTERSVQIWFQNRRAKIKNIAKKSIESGEDCSEIPESMRRYLALQAIESGKGIGRDLIGRPGFAYGSGMLLNADSNNSKVVINHLSCRSLSIGNWRRIGQTAMDLVIFYSPDKCCVTYYINNDNAGYKIEYPFSAIKSIILDNGDPHSNAEGASQRLGGLIIELTRPPHFFMDTYGQGGFQQCGDFTEEQQASKIMVHHLGGHPKVLSGQLAKLFALDSFQNRHALFDIPNPVTVSAPVSPIIHRPVSQPSHPVAQTPLNVFQDTPWGVGVGLAAPRGHKRQRSRSVPNAIDFAMFRQQPLQPFLIPPPPSAPSAQPHQQPLQQVPEHSPFLPQAEIIAPIPQYQIPHFVQTPVGPSLSIDTSADFGLGMHGFNAPMSATTAPSPATDFGGPAFTFSAGGQQDSLTASNMMPTPFAMQFAPSIPEMPVHTPIPHPSVTPIPTFAPNPVIADQSPPMSSVGRSTSAEFFHIPQDSAIPDDSMLLAEMYAKQPMNLAFRPMPEEHVQQPNQYDMSAMMNYIDPSNLGQSHQGF